jgi:hypothetical protein
MQHYTKARGSHLIGMWRGIPVRQMFPQIANKAQFVRMRTKSYGGELLKLSSALFQYWQLRKSD